MLTADTIRGAQLNAVAVRTVRRYIGDNLHADATQVAIPVAELQPALPDSVWQQAVYCFKGFKEVVFKTETRELFLAWTPHPLLAPPPAAPTPTAAATRPRRDNMAAVVAVSCDFPDCGAPAVDHNATGRVRLYFCDAHRCRECTGVHMKAADGRPCWHTRKRMRKRARDDTPPPSADDIALAEADSDDETIERPAKQARTDIL